MNGGKLFFASILPYTDDASLEKIGKMLYAKHCKSCHGDDGLGDSFKSPELETYSGDFTSENPIF